MQSSPFRNHAPNRYPLLRIPDQPPPPHLPQPFSHPPYQLHLTPCAPTTLSLTAAPLIQGPLAILLRSPTPTNPNLSALTLRTPFRCAHHEPSAQTKRKKVTTPQTAPTTAVRELCWACVSATAG